MCNQIGYALTGTAVERLVGLGRTCRESLILVGCERNTIDGEIIGAEAEGLIYVLSIPPLLAIKPNTYAVTDWNLYC